MDAVSYSLASKQAQRIEKFIENPDSTSGILTQPSVIQTGEIVNVPVGRTAILANTQIDGDLIIDGDVFIPTGSSVDFSNGIKVNGENIALSIPTSYHLLSGNLSVDNTVLTNGFGLYLYTGNTTTLPTINLGMDITSQWGNTADETYGYLIKIKSRSAVGDWTWVNSVRGITKYISSNTTAVEGTDANMFTLSTVAGVTTLNIGTSTRTNTNGVTYVVEVYQTTHRKTGVTNQGKTYTEHYNPDTGFTIEGYDGSSLAGHEIPHSLGRNLDILHIKNLSAVTQWISKSQILQANYVLSLNQAIAQTLSAIDDVTLGENSSTISTSGQTNQSTNQHIMFGWANSYFDESGKLTGNFEIGVYQGTGAAGNKVVTRGKPAWVMIKRLDAAEGWYVTDNTRGSNYKLAYNSSAVEITGFHLIFTNNGFSVENIGQGENASGGQYLYMVVYDNDSGSGKSKYPKATDTSNVQVNNAIIPLAHGVDSNGSKNSIVVANETITGLTYTQGKNYLYKTDTGYGVKPYEPRYLSSELVRRFAGEQPDYYDVDSNKWFNTDAGSELVTNGKFTSNINGWLAQVTPSAISWVSGQGKVSYDNNNYIYQDIVTKIGVKYKIKFDYSVANITNAYLRFAVLRSDFSDNINSSFPLNTSGEYEEEFIAESTVTRIIFTAQGNAGAYGYIDSISCFPIDITPTTEIPESRNYLNHIVHADADGGVLYVEELPKIEYKNVIKAEEYLGKNACTFYANIDMATTPPTVRESYNLATAIRTGNGYLDIYFEDKMDYNSYSIVCCTNDLLLLRDEGGASRQLNKVSLVVATTGGTPTNADNLSIAIFGGRN